MCLDFIVKTRHLSLVSLNITLKMSDFFIRVLGSCTPLVPSVNLRFISQFAGVQYKSAFFWYGSEKALMSYRPKCGTIEDCPLHDVIKAGSMAGGHFSEGQAPWRPCGLKEDSSFRQSQRRARLTIEKER